MPTTTVTDRMVILRIDDLMELIKDYCGEDDFPFDTMPVTLLVKPTEMGKFCIIARSDAWRQDEKPLEVKLTLKRFHSVG